MVAFHATYDAVTLYGFQIDWFLNPLIQNAWRNSISWTFLLIAGIMCSFSRNNVRRAARYLGVALLIWIATTVAAVDTPINYGIIFCMGASTALYVLVNPLLKRLPNAVGFAVFAIVFLATLQIPQSCYDVPHIAWLGFPDFTFSSGDYYPLIPYSFMFLAGSCLGAYLKRYIDGGHENKVLEIDLPVLRFIGKHPLSIYLIHQPLLIVLFDIYCQII